ncbi:MAG: hypothetical protein JO246_00920 [Frankiaceae bacterium]|nr:hypothetical protein [Frankiaceae bacterium]
MPIVRDGRNQVDEFRTEPPAAVPSGPVVRDRVSEARMADFAAERAAAERSHHDAGVNRVRQQIEDGKSLGAGAHWARKRAEKAERVFTALRETPGYEQAARRLGMSRSALEGLVRQYRVDGTLPADVSELIRTRARTGGRPPAVAAISPEPPDTEPQDQEAGVVATPAVAAEPLERDEPAVGSTPPGPTPAPHTVSVPIDQFVAAANAVAPGLLAIEGEDRCAHGQFVGMVTVVICDRPTGHPGHHRGRLIRVGMVTEQLTFLGHAAVAP